MERLVGLVNEVEECYISAGNTSLECQNISSQVWFPGTTEGTAIVFCSETGETGASKAFGPSISQKAFTVKLYSLGKTAHVTFCKLDIHTLLTGILF